MSVLLTLYNRIHTELQWLQTSSWVNMCIYSDILPLFHSLASVSDGLWFISKQGKMQRATPQRLANQVTKRVSVCTNDYCYPPTPVPSVVMERGAGGRGCGCKWRWLAWQRHTTQSALLVTSKVTKSNKNKWPAVKAAPTLWVWFLKFSFFLASLFAFMWVCDELIECSARFPLVLITSGLSSWLSGLCVQI